MLTCRRLLDKNFPRDAGQDSPARQSWECDSLVTSLSLSILSLKLFWEALSTSSLCQPKWVKHQGDVNVSCILYMPRVQALSNDALLYSHCTSIATPHLVSMHLATLQGHSNSSTVPLRTSSTIVVEVVAVLLDCWQQSHVRRWAELCSVRLKWLTFQRKDGEGGYQ